VSRVRRLLDPGRDAAVLPDLDVKPRTWCFVSGIGCAARFPYYMNVYGLHASTASARDRDRCRARPPDLDVWVIGGDGDMLSIGATT